MKTSRLVLATLLLLCTSVLPLAGQAEIRLPGLSGGELTEGELGRGSHVIVFWTTWSPRGRDIVTRANALVEAWGPRVKTVNFQEDAADVRSFLAGQSLRAPVFLDTSGALAKKYHVNSAPWLLVLKDGRTAFSERLPADADAVIRQILG